MERSELITALSKAGCLDPNGEADVLLDSARRQNVDIEELLGRRLKGEPLPWIAGSVMFCDSLVAVEPGVFVPRPHTEALARRAVELLPPEGIALDLCTGSGAVALATATAHPRAQVLATDIDPTAVACAKRNGVDALLGDLDEPVPGRLERGVDVVTAVVPYVPTSELHLLPRDVRAFEPRVALDGGVDGTAVLRRVVAAAPRWLRPGGALLLELGGDEGAQISAALTAADFVEIRVHRDDDGQERFVEARLTSEAVTRRR